VNAAKTFLRSATKKTRKRAKITLDASAASHRAAQEMKDGRTLQKSKNPIHPILQQPHLTGTLTSQTACQNRGVRRSPLEPAGNASQLRRWIEFAAEPLF